MGTEGMPVPRKKSPAGHEKFVTYVQTIATCLTGNQNVTSPNPSVATLTTKADALAQANVKARNRAPGAVADRNDKRRDLEGDLNHLVDHVSGVIKTLGVDPAAATTIILSTGLSVKKRGPRVKAPLTAKYGSISGEVLLVAAAVARVAMYYWEYSLDQKTWTTVPETMQSRITLSGLTAGQVYYFRFRAKTRKGMGDYTDVVKLMVL
jgi:hypothetical protein